MIGVVVEPISCAQLRYPQVKLYENNDDAAEISLFGVTYKPIDNVSFKFELGSKDDADVMRFGLGYMF